MIFAYPYARSTLWNGTTELMLSIRALEMNFIDDFTILVIGKPEDHPEWLKQEYYKTISVDHRLQKQAKIAIAYTWLKNNINGPFAICSDDEYLIKSIGTDDLLIPYYIENMTGIKRPFRINAWQKLLWDTNETIVKLGIKEIFNYSTHIPRVFDPVVLKEIWPLFKINSGQHLIAQAYFNMINPDNKKLLDIRAGFYNQKRIEITNQHAWINHNDNGLRVIKNFLWDTFGHTKSRFEN